MNRLTVSLFALALTSACAVPYRSIALPVALQTAPSNDVIEVTGKKNRTKVFDFEIRQVDAGRTRGLAINIGPVNLMDKFTQQRKFTIERGGAPFIESVSCTSVNKDAKGSFIAYYRHTYTCTSPGGFELSVDQPASKEFNGKVKLGSVNLELSSTRDFADGTTSGLSPCGFHLRRDGRWLATFEYYKQGKVYLAPDLTPDEHDAVLATVVSISSTGRWFQLKPDGSASYGL
ncbi:MAG: hypothetical protein QM817_27780 [Archangium sp.]